MAEFDDGTTESPVVPVAPRKRRPFWIVIVVAVVGVVVGSLFSAAIVQETSKPFSAGTSVAYPSTKGDFRAYFPGKPEVSSKKVDSATAPFTTTTAEWISLHGQDYAIVQNAFSSPIPDDQVDDVLTGSLTAMISEFPGSTLTSSALGAFHGVRAMVGHAVLKSGVKTEIVIVWRDKTQYVVFAADRSSSNRTLFLSSFAFTDTTAGATPAPTAAKYSVTESGVEKAIRVGVRTGFLIGTWLVVAVLIGITALIVFRRRRPKAATA